MKITDSDELELIFKHREGYRGIFWHTDDFEKQAQEHEQREKIEIYDRTTFEDALDKMLREHDAQYGITWDIIDVYLDLYCKLPANYPKQLKADL